MELNEEDGTSVLVHNYAVAGGDLKDHIVYLNYLTDAFKPEMIVIDNAGYQFIDACNENESFKKKQIKFFDFNSDKEGVDYEKMIRKARRQYNRQNGVICFKQNFTTNFIRNANEFLQACIDHKKLWFASRVGPNSGAFQRATSQAINLRHKKGETILDLIEEQDLLIYQVKKQCVLIEVKATAKGVQTFDLPQHLKRNTSASRARKDNYTALMLGNWGVKSYYDLMAIGENEFSNTFTPLMIN